MMAAWPPSPSPPTRAKTEEAAPASSSDAKEDATGCVDATGDTGVGADGGAVGTQQQARYSVFWTGEPTWVDHYFDVSELLCAGARKGHQPRAGVGNARDGRSEQGGNGNHESQLGSGQLGSSLQGSPPKRSSPQTGSSFHGGNKHGSTHGSPPTSPKSSVKPTRPFTPRLHGELVVSASAIDLRSIVEAEMAAEGKPCLSRSSGPVSIKGDRTEGVEFTCRVTARSFPPPAPPSHLSLMHRTGSSLALKFRPPRRWGGCALKRYDVEIREIGWNAKDAEAYYVGGWEHALDVPASGPACAQIIRRVWMAEIRVRTWSVACGQPSEWSHVLTVEEPPEPVSESRPPVLNAGGADEEASVHSVHSSAVQEPLDEQFMVRHRMSDVGVMEQQGYGSLRRLQQATPPCPRVPSLELC